MSSRLPEPRIHRKRRSERRCRRGTPTGIALALLAACATTGTPSPSVPAPGDDWVDRTVDELTLRERAAQLVMVWMTGGYASRTDEEFVRIEGLVTGEGIGGVVISLGTPHSYVSRLNRLQAVAEVPLLVAADFESGAGFRAAGVYALPSGMDMGGATRFPPAMAFGAVDDIDVAYEAGRVTGLEARALGVHLNFAPVLDVNNNPDNPIINTRSFGESPWRVAELGVAYIQGARSAGLMTTAKHFPGHGDTGTDSHEALPVITADRSRLDALELVPFRRAIEAGVDAVMTAHVAAPEILGEGAPPATLSSYFMTDLLRDELGFDGVLFTDALDMAAIVDGYGPGEAAVRALEAGADVLLMPTDPARAIDAVVEAVGSGRLTEDRIEASVRRLLTMKAAAGLDAERAVDPSLVTDLVGTEEHASFADTVARRSITLVRDLAGDFPVDTTVTRRVLSVTYAGDGDVVAGRVFDGRLAEALDVTRARLGPESPPSAYAALAESAAAVDLVILSTHATPVASEEVPGAHPLDDLVARVALSGRPTALVSFGSPYVLSMIPDPDTYLIAWGNAPPAQRAAADALMGRFDVAGRLPIALPPLHRVGEGLRRAEAVEWSRGSTGHGVDDSGMDSAALARVDRIIQRAVADSVTPGAALAVGRHGRLVRLQGYGRLDWAPGSAPVTDSTLYDLASLTKVISTTTAMMTLVDGGMLALDDPVGRYLDEWSEGWKAEVRLRDLLVHRAGLPPFRPFWRDLEGRAAYREAIGDLPMEYGVGSRTVYSDIGLITLQFVIEAVTGRPLDDYVRENVFEPLGMSSTGFNPPRTSWSAIAPTEMDSMFRLRHIRGEVHDENAFALGGVAGHAGLFSNVRDLARFGSWILEAARAGRGLESVAAGEDGLTRSSVPAPETVARFTRRLDDTSSRALGWDTSSNRSSSGRFFSAGSFGHTGFTGTSIWIDPDRDVFVVLLTNRVNPTRDERGHIPLRRAVHDAVAAAIRDVPVEPRDRP